MRQSCSQHSRKSPCHARRRGFTLIEILIVIAIIALLGAILFPVFARVRENGRRISCASNLKQLGTAFQMYTQDYNGRMPGASDAPVGANVEGGWMFYSVYGVGTTDAVFDPARGSIFSYVRDANIYKCPSDAVGDRTGNSYAINRCVVNIRRTGSAPSPTPVGFSPGRRVNYFRNPSQTMLLGEETRPQNSTDTQPTGDLSTDDGFFNLRATTGPSAEPENWQNYFVERHNSGGNVLFVDGHVKWYNVGQAREQRIQIGGTGNLADGCPGESGPTP
jgi:prepilin-type N-terminal cleavage/methylation domain-containing protein/prepilin-type processing-associated H-X9-DG protein